MPVSPWFSAAAPVASKFKAAAHGHAWYQHLAVLMPIVTIYFCLAFYRIDHQSFWLDEVLSLGQAHPQGAFLDPERWWAGRGPLYFRILNLWTHLGADEFTLRALSALFGGVAVGFTYLMGLRLHSRRMAWMGATLLATSPFFIWYSQEVRYITLMIALAVVTMYSVHVAFSSTRLGPWFVHGGSLVLAIATFVTNAFLGVAQALYLIWAPVRRTGLRRGMASLLVVFVLFMWFINKGQVDRLEGFWRMFFVHATASDQRLSSVPRGERLQVGSAREFTVMTLPYTLFAFSAGFSLGPSVRDLHIARSWPALRPHLLIIALCSLLFGSLLIMGLASLRRQLDAAKLLLTWFAVPIIATLGLSALIPSAAYNVRYVAMAFPAYILILAVAIASLQRPAMQVALLAAVLAINSLSLAHYYFDPYYHREDARAAARYLESATRPGDIIVVVGSIKGLQYYYRGNVPVTGAGKALIRERLALTEHLQNLSEGHDRLWLVMIRPWTADPKSTVKRVLDETSFLIQQHEFPGVNIYAYRVQ